MRRRIWLLTVGMTALVVLAFAIPLAILIRENFEDRALREARLTAENTGYYISASNPDPAAISHYLAGYDSETAGRTSVVLPDGRLIGAAPPSLPTGDDDHGEEGDDPGPGKVSTPDVSSLGGGTVTEVKAATPSGTVRVLTYLTDSQMHAGVVAWWLLLAGACLGLVALSAGGAEIVSRRMVRSLTATAQTADRLTHGERRVRAPEAGVPEVAMVGRALNRLASRIDELIANERETAADVSHRLRTPLTRLRLDVDALPDGPSARRLAQHVSHLERTLTAVIHAARRLQREGIAPSSDATAASATGSHSGRHWQRTKAGRFVSTFPTCPCRCVGSGGPDGCGRRAAGERNRTHTGGKCHRGTTESSAGLGSDSGGLAPDRRRTRDQRGGSWNPGWSRSPRPQRPWFDWPGAGHRPPVRRGRWR